MIYCNGAWVNKAYVKKVGKREKKETTRHMRRALDRFFKKRQ